MLEGVPGLAKTLLISSIAKCTGLGFSRIQFTPDLMPADITGTEIIREDKSTGSRELVFLPGPIFNSIILADEINRTPPKTQAALLEAMQERQVTAGGECRPLPQPFFVLATQNPIEQEGTYPLPEAQLDRFLLKISVHYPTEAEELEVILRTTGSASEEIKPVISGEQVLELQQLVRKTPIAEGIARYALALVRATRNLDDGGDSEIAPLLRWGAGPRAGQSLVLCAKARACLAGHEHVSIEDIRSVTKSVLRHRIRCSFEAEARGINVDNVVEQLLERIQLPDSSLESDKAVSSALG
ncbi:MAG: MoxR family ATPase [Planctomycetes bacterium]|nr:MoxR family ATPase [Planctomycetota bacterium]